MIGLVIGFSSVAGAIFDFVICKIFKNTDFRRVILAMFVICFTYPMLLWQANSVGMFLFAMAVWGVYYDLLGFGMFNFVGKYIKRDDHSSSFGIIQIFRALGSIVALLVISWIVTDVVDWRTFSAAWVVLAIGFLLFLVLLYGLRRRHPDVVESFKRPRRKHLLIEVHLWEKLGKLMIPVLMVTFYLLFIDAFFWTLAPLYAEESAFAGFGGLFLTAYVLPELMVGWFISPLTNHFGKKRTAYLCLLTGSLILSSFFFIESPILSIFVVFIASMFINLAYPAVNSSYADYISDAPQVDGEIEGLEDFFVNMGYVFGPLAAGILAEILSIPAAFSILGLMGAILAVVLLIAGPKHIIIKTKQSEL